MFPMFFFLLSYLPPVNTSGIQTLAEISFPMGDNKAQLMLTMRPFTQSLTLADSPFKNEGVLLELFQSGPSDEQDMLIWQSFEPQLRASINWVADLAVDPAAGTAWISLSNGGSQLTLYSASISQEITPIPEEASADTVELVTPEQLNLSTPPEDLLRPILYIREITMSREGNLLVITLNKNQEVSRILNFEPGPGSWSLAP